MFIYTKTSLLDQYLILINNCKCLVGNSSSGLREGAFLGIPVVNIGSRQSFVNPVQTLLMYKMVVKKFSTQL